MKLSKKGVGGLRTRCNEDIDGDDSDEPRRYANRLVMQKY